MIPSYLLSWEEQVVCSREGRIERTLNSASRIIEFEELLGKLTEEKKRVFSTIKENKVANKNGRDKLTREELT